MRNSRGQQPSRRHSLQQDSHGHWIAPLPPPASLSTQFNDQSTNQSVLSADTIASQQAVQLSQMMRQLQVITGTVRPEPLNVLQCTLEHIQLLQTQCKLLEQRLNDCVIRCAEAEQRAERSEGVIKAVCTFSNNLQITPVSDSSPFSSSPSLIRSPSSAFLTAVNNHSQDEPVDQSSPSSTEPTRPTSALNQSQTITQPSNPTSSPTPSPSSITALLDAVGAVVRCSISFAELFGFNYLFSPSPPGTYNIFSLVPRNTQEVASILQQAVVSSTVESSCVLVVDGWSKQATVLMTVRPAGSQEGASDNHAQPLLSANFQILRLVDVERPVPEMNNST